MALQRVRGAYTSLCGTSKAPTLCDRKMTETSSSDALPEYPGLTSLHVHKCAVSQPTRSFGGIAERHPPPCITPDQSVSHISVSANHFIPLLLGEVLVLVQLVCFSMLTLR